MAISIRVYPQYSPRIVEILSPTTEATVQDIVNACRAWEDSVEGQYYPFIIDAAGKEDLGGSVKVGITATLQNAQVAFEAQTGSDSTGTVTTADTTGVILIDSGATFITDGILAGDTILNSTDGSITTVLSVDSETQLTTFGLADGTDNQFANTDSYKIWNKIQCEVSGGNLVAVDDLGATISSFLPTAQTHVVRTSSSSATLSEQDAIQYSSYGGGVSLDINSTTSGTEYPSGNQEFPVNNITDAVTIANERGFSTIFIRSDMTGANKINSGTDLTDFIIQGRSRSNTTIEIDTSASTSGMVIRNCTVSGVLDGMNSIEFCDVGSLNYFNGTIEECGLFGTIALDGASEAVMNHCYTLDQDSPPTIDMGGSGQDLAMPNYSGLITITNLTSATEEVGIGLNHGAVVLDPTVTAGTIVISGVGTLTDNATSYTTLNTDGLINKNLIATTVSTEIGAEIQYSTYQNSVWVDTVNGTSGTTYPTGNRENPVDNLADAVTIAGNIGVNTITFLSDFTFVSTTNISNFVLKGLGYLSTVFTLDSGCILANCRLEEATATGAVTGISGFRRMLLQNFSGVSPVPASQDIIVEDCFLDGTFTIPLLYSGTLIVKGCSSYVPGASTPVVDFSGNNADLAMRNYVGGIEVRNMSGSNAVSMDFDSGQVVFDSTCTSGSATVRGNAYVTDNSGASFTVNVDGNTLEQATQAKLKATTAAQLSA